MASKLFSRRKKPPNPPSATSSQYNRSGRLKSISKDTLSIIVNALKESSDAFPPLILKGAVGCVSYILDLARDKAKSNQEESRHLALRAKTIIDIIVKNEPDPHCLDPDLAAYIEAFTNLLQNLAKCMKRCSTKKFLSRCLQHNKDRESINNSNRDLDEALHSLMLILQLKQNLAISTIILASSNIIEGQKEQRDEFINLSRRLNAILQMSLLLTGILF